MKIALFEPDALSIWLFRAGLIRRLVAGGHSVHVLCAPDQYVEHVRSLGSVVVPLNMTRYVTPPRDLRLCAEIYRCTAYSNLL